MRAASPRATLVVNTENFSPLTFGRRQQGQFGCNIFMKGETFMKSSNFKNIPAGVLLIAAFYIFGALVLLVSVFTNPAGVSQSIALVHGLSPIIGAEILVAVAALALVLAYGLISLSRWGFFLAITYSLYLAGISLFMGGLNFLWTGQAEFQTYFGNFLWSMLVIIYLLFVRGRFFSPRLVESHQ